MFHVRLQQDALTVAAMLSVQNPFVHPRGGGRERRERVREAMEEFAVTEGDHITYLNVFNSFEEADSSSDWCDENCINYRALVRAGEIRSQLARCCVIRIPIVERLLGSRSLETHTRCAPCLWYIANAQKPTLHSTVVLLIACSSRSHVPANHAESWWWRNRKVTEVT